MTSDVRLNVNDSNKVRAHARGDFADRHGNLGDLAGAEITWIDKSNKHSFEVRFYDVSKCQVPAWPFEPHGDDSANVLKVNGTHIRTLKSDLTGSFWKYEVKGILDPGNAAPSPVPLDPMIIVRDSSADSSSLIDRLVDDGVGWMTTAMAFAAGLLVAWAYHRYKQPARR